MVLTFDALQELIASIQEFAFQDRGNGHYVKCHGYTVELDLYYHPVSCSCKDYIYRQEKVNGSCKHMKAVSAFYASSLKDLLNNQKNPIVQVYRACKKVSVRWTQLSQDEARAYYRSLYPEDFSINVYA